MAKTLAWSAAGLVCLWVGVARAEEAAPGSEESLPRLAWDMPIQCIEDPAGKRWRVQCIKAEGDLTLRCLLAPDTTSDGGSLQRVQPCEDAGREGWERLKLAGAELAPALAEAPEGWHRDMKGRVFQVTFDLLQRFQLGAQWAPAFGFEPQEISLGRVRFEMGLVASWLSTPERERHTLRALEGQVAILDLTSRGLLFAYDLDTSSDEPLLRLTTFFGPPRRHDLYMDLGWGLRLLGVGYRPHHAEALDLEVLELHAAWDLWQSPDLWSHLRLETGLAAVALFDFGDPARERWALAPGAALDGRFGLDPKGHHLLEARLGWQLPIWLLGAEIGATRTRATASAAYEWILVALNDQPVTLRVDVAASYRDDLARGTSPWDLTAGLGLRFSFWAPARLAEALSPLPAR